MDSHQIKITIRNQGPIKGQLKIRRKYLKTDILKLEQRI